MKQQLALVGFLFYFFIFSFNSSFAQNNDDHRNGIRLGFHSAQLVDSGEELLRKNRNGFYIGYFREQPFAKILIFNAGLDYFENGSRQDSDNKVALGYLSIPLSLKAKFGPVHALGGVSGSLKLYNNETFMGEEVDVDSDKYDSLDAAAFIGAGIKVLFFGVEIRYHWGLGNVVEEFSNRYLQIGANVYFGR